MHELLQTVSPFWLWLALAFMLLAVEVLVVPTGYLLCLGTSAVAMAAVAYLAPGLSWLWCVSLYSALSVLSCGFWWLALRRRRAASGGEETLNRKTRQLEGYRTVLEEDIKAGRGRIRVNDSAWPVVADKDYPAGTMVEVVAVTGIVLKVKAAP